jgi:hypothetical protein
MGFFDRLLDPKLPKFNSPGELRNALIDAGASRN